MVQYDVCSMVQRVSCIGRLLVYQIIQNVYDTVSYSVTALLLPRVIATITLGRALCYAVIELVIADNQSNYRCNVFGY